MGFDDAIESAKQALDSGKQSFRTVMKPISDYIDEKAKDPRWERFDLESPSIQRDIDEWGAKTNFGMIAGMLFGGFKEGFASAHWQPLLPSQAGSRTWNERQELWKTMWEKRMLRVAGGTVRGAAKLGAFTGMFCGIQRFLEIYRDEIDTLNTVVAASTTAAVLGLAMPGSFKWRMRTCLLGAALGVVAGVPLGFIHAHLPRMEEQLQQEQQMEQDLNPQKD